LERKKETCALCLLVYQGILLLCVTITFHTQGYGKTHLNLMPPKATKPAPAPQQSGLTKKRQKAAPKPPKPVEEQLKRYFNSLYAQIDGGHLKNAIKTTEKSVFK
jgi:hypothetical protein